MHGPSECMGNIIELCARELYPDPKINLGFIMCLTKDYKNIPERSLVEDCALEHAMDIRKLNECAARDDGGHGMEMLRKSIQRSADVSTETFKISCNKNLFILFLTMFPRLFRPTSRLAAPSASTTKSTASATAANGPTALTAPASTTSSLQSRSCRAALKRLKHTLPQLARLSQRICHRQRVHARLLTTRHNLERLNDTIQPNRLSRRLRRARLKRNMNNMDMEMVVRRLVMHIQLELVRINAGVRRNRRIHQLGAHVLQPGNMSALQVPQRPDIPPLHQRKQVQRIKRLSIPVEIRQQQKPFIAGFAQLSPVYNVLDLFFALNNVKYPVQSPLLPLLLHIWPYLVPVNLWRLCNKAHTLLAVLVDVSLCAWPDEVNLEVRVEIHVFFFLFVCYYGVFTA